MDAVLLSRIQFALTIAFHYVFPPLSIGLGVVLVVLEALFLRTGNPVWERATRFWVRVFGLTFSMGVATGIVMEFQFGTNWAAYSRFVGDVFGSALAAEGIFAFFLESGFLGLLLFGWDRVGPRTHFLATLMVCLGSHFSAVWITVANSWMQTPAGFRLERGAAGLHAVTTHFWSVVLNPSAPARLTHVFVGAWQAGAFLVLSVSAWWLLRGRHRDVAWASLRVALVVASVATLGSLASGHWSARVVADHQPVKLAAMEGLFPPETPGAPLHLFGWVDVAQRRTRGVAIPDLLSLLAHDDPAAPVAGLESVPRDRWPPIQPVFQAFHAMVAIGLATAALAFGGMLLWWRGGLDRQRWFLRLLVPAVLLPQIANQLGWVTAEVGRQPWIVYGVLRTDRAVSPAVGAGEVAFSLALFTLVYGLLFVLFLVLLDGKIREGPEPAEAVPAAMRHRAEA
jgi:cytochrome d ubiquinol oxidase subunit I